MSQSLYQSFTETADPSQGAARCAALRAELTRRGLSGFVVPRADEHQNEYVPAGAERLAWLSGFTGSAGTAIVLADKAAVFVDGRYTIAVREQVDATVFTPVPLAETTPEAWLEQNIEGGSTVAYDPWLHTPAQVKRLLEAVEKAGGTLVPVIGNPLDAVWSDRPAAARGAIVLYPEKLAGETAPAKLARIAEALAKDEALLVSDPHAVAWAFNIRGSDVAHTPLPLAYALIPKSGSATLFVDGQKLSHETRAALAPITRIEEPDDLLPTLARLGTDGAIVRFDQATVASALVSALEAAGGEPRIGADPIALMKATKNAAELEGARAAHLRDGAAMVRFLAWFAREAPKGALTEISAALALEGFRRDTGLLKDLSFPTISAAGPNAAIPHYRVTTASDRRIEPGIYLVDSGAQYEDGTTDITRTLAVGTPTAAMRDRVTRVLRGHIAIATAVFPKGTSGAQIDAYARRPLWEAGLDFDHGTGHGVGAYLSVHEGPQRISKVSNVALAPGMILSNEPGYYEAGAYGVRLENLVVVRDVEIEGGDRKMLGFETITLAPFDRALIEPALMSQDEIAWLDAYHARVCAALSPLLPAEDRAWLEDATRPLAG